MTDPEDDDYDEDEVACDWCGQTIEDWEPHFRTTYMGDELLVCEDCNTALHRQKKG